jgi:uncharacterized protein with PQ loop repeat
MVDWVGWLSSTILLLTLVGQVVKQWRADTVAGVSKWLFFGQITASTGFVTYSILVDNLIFVVTNCLILITAIVGQGIYLYKRHAR